VKSSFKYGVSAIALLAAISLAQAQTSERQGGGASSGSEHSMGERGGSQAEHSQGGASSQHQGKSAEERGEGGSGGQHQGKSAQERGEGGASGQHQGKSVEDRGEGGFAAQHQGKSSQERWEGSSASQKEQQRGQSAEHNRNQEQGQGQERNRAENRADRNASGLVRPNAVSKAKASATPERSVRTAAFRVRKAVAVKRSSAAARGKVRMPAAQGAEGASLASLANKGPGFTASWFVTPQSTAITAEMWISLSRSGAGFRIPSNFTIRRRKLCRSIRYSRATKSWCSTT